MVSDKNARWAKSEWDPLILRIFPRICCRLFEATTIYGSQIQIRIHEYRNRYRQSHSQSLLSWWQKYKNLLSFLRRCLTGVLVITVSFFIVFTNIWQCVDFTQRPCSYPRLRDTASSDHCLLAGSWGDVCMIILSISLAWRSRWETEVYKENKVKWGKLYLYLPDKV